jgi:hypothetical protein
MQAMLYGRMGDFLPGKKNPDGSAAENHLYPILLSRGLVTMLQQLVVWHEENSFFTEQGHAVEVDFVPVHPVFPDNHKVHSVYLKCLPASGWCQLRMPEKSHAIFITEQEKFPKRPVHLPLLEQFAQIFP